LYIYFINYLLITMNSYKSLLFSFLFYLFFFFLKKIISNKKALIYLCFKKQKYIILIEYKSYYRVEQ